MLTIHQAKQKAQKGRPAKLGLAIAGGGPLGAIYELGALRALDEVLLGTRLNRLDVYVGISAGSFLAASLANGISTAEMCRIFMNTPDAEFSFKPEKFLRLAYREYLHRAAKVPGILLDELTDYIRHPIDSSLSESLNAFSRVVPTGFFSNKSVDSFLSAAYNVPGRTNDFRKLRCKLYVLAVDLDNGAAIRFGSSGYNHVPISQAVQASAALPGLYPPVKIDGHYYVDGALRRTLHGSAALNEGVDVLIGINPLVPYDSDKPDDHQDETIQNLIEGGLPLVLSQTFRALIQSRIKVGFEKYRKHYPQASLLLIEPNRGDSEIFFTNIFSYSSRSHLCEHAYQITRKQIRKREKHIEQLLAPLGLGLDKAKLHEKDRTLTDSINTEPRRYSPAATDLSKTLDDLDEWLDIKQAS